MGSFANTVQNYCHKGKQILVGGRLKSSSWEQDGQKRSKLEVVANNIILLGGSGQTSSEQKDKPASKGEADKPAKSSKKSESESDSEVMQEADYDFDQDQTSPEDVPF